MTVLCVPYSLDRGSCETHGPHESYRNCLICTNLAVTVLYVPKQVVPINLAVTVLYVTVLQLPESGRDRLIGAIDLVVTVLLVP